jgi:hypothetical protein
MVSLKPCPSNADAYIPLSKLSSGQYTQDFVIVGDIKSKVAFTDDAISKLISVIARYARAFGDGQAVETTFQVNGQSEHFDDLNGRVLVHLLEPQQE